jgi:HlyD family secretion protein
VDPQRGSIEVRLRAPAPPAFLKPDMTVSVDLTVASKKRVLTLPSDSVRGAATAEPWVLVAENGRVARRGVTLGIRGQDAVEVAAGLEDGAAVLLPGKRTLAPGQRVRPEPGVP